LRELPSVEVAEVEVVWEPMWTIDMATDDVKKQLSGL
jgi:metal-sulfur cluster biosynthetic enzyme